MSWAERDRLTEIVLGITAGDQLEIDHQLDTLAWIASGVELYRYRTRASSPEPSGGRSMIAAAPQATLDPHLQRFVAKLRRDLAL